MNRIDYRDFLAKGRKVSRGYRKSIDEISVHNMDKSDILFDLFKSDWYKNKFRIFDGQLDNEESSLSYISDDYYVGNMSILSFHTHTHVYDSQTLFRRVREQ